MSENDIDNIQNIVVGENQNEVIQNVNEDEQQKQLNQNQELYQENEQQNIPDNTNIKSIQQKEYKQSNMQYNNNIVDENYIPSSIQPGICVLIENSQQILQSIQEQQPQNYVGIKKEQEDLNNEEKKQQQQQPIPEKVTELKGREIILQKIKKKYYNLAQKVDFQTSRPIYIDRDKDPYLRITVKLDSKDESLQEYFVGIHGMEKSQKNTDIQEIVVGRLVREVSEQNEEKKLVYPQDISIPQAQVSRIHFKINYKPGLLNFKSPLSRSFREFLRLTVSRHNQKQTDPNQVAKQSSAQMFQQHINQIIWSFLAPPKIFQIYDINSSIGTYIKLDSSKFYKLEIGQIYLIGDMTLITILGMALGQYHQLQQKFYRERNEIGEKQAQEQYNKDVKIQSDPNYKSQVEFINYLINYKNSKFDSFFVHDCGQSLMDKINNFEAKSNNKEDQISGLKETYFPYIKVKISTTGDLFMSEHILVEKYKATNKMFQFGRSKECDIPIPNQSVSRKQSVIQFQGDGWYIKDGDGELNPSTFGTSISLMKEQEKQTEEQSSPYEFEEQTEVKIDKISISIKAINNKKLVQQFL